MALSDAQIERYSRQIIVGEIGGRGQERLLNSTLMIAGEFGDIEAVLPYVVGAGVGTILLESRANRIAIDRAIAEMRGLNADARVSRIEETAAGSANLILILSGSNWAVKIAETTSRMPGQPAVILARLDTPGKIAVMPKVPPCPACAEGALLAPVSARAPHAGVIAMVAATETIKFIAAQTRPAAEIIEFDGYQCKRRTLSAALDARCACSMGRNAGLKR